MFSNGGQDIKRNDIVCAGGVNVDQPVANIGIGKDSSGDKQAEQVIYQEGVGVDQAATSSGGNILIEAILQQLGLVFSGHANHIQVSGAG
jgi:hypothetical protein